MKLVVLLFVVWTNEVLNSTPQRLNGVCMGPGVRIDEGDGVVNGAACVTNGSDVPVRSPSIADNNSAGSDPFTYKLHQRVGGPLGYGNKESSPGSTFNTAKHPLPPNRMSPMVFMSTEFTLFDFDGLVRTADLLRAALQKTNIASVTY
jgi:hypothetical protein